MVPASGKQAPGNARAFPIAGRSFPVVQNTLQLLFKRLLLNGVFLRENLRR